MKDAQASGCCSQALGKFLLTFPVCSTFHCMRSNLNMSSFNEAILFSGDSILIKEGCEIKKYKERDFSQKSSLLTPTIIR